MSASDASAASPAVQYEQNGGKCGVCGDNYALEPPRPHEAGGEFANGVITRRYAPGQVSWRRPEGIRSGRFTQRHAPGHWSGQFTEAHTSAVRSVGADK